MPEQAATDVDIVQYLHQQDVLLHPHTLEVRPRWGAEDDALELALNVLSRVDDPILIDAGAAAGEWTLLAVCLPRLRVFAFEPHSGVASILRQNVGLNGLYEQVNLHTMALGAKPGVGELHVPADPEQLGLATLGQEPGFEIGQTRSVCVATIDQFCAFHEPTLIKVDTEGSERDVVLGAIAVIERCAPAFVLEVCQKRTRQFGYDATELVELMGALGYQNVRLANENRYFWHDEWQRP